jgi:hypothetical protein
MTHTLVDTQIVDEAVDAYVEWRAACARVRDTYRCWAQARGRAGAFARHAAALEHEERAAARYAYAIAWVAFVAGGPDASLVAVGWAPAPGPT